MPHGENGYVHYPESKNASREVDVDRCRIVEVSATESAGLITGAASER